MLTTVRVHRNLHRGDWSVTVKGKVVAHVEAITLRDVTFRVSQAMRSRVLERKQRGVHAWAQGEVSDADLNALPAQPITYNPYRSDRFVVTSTGVPVTRCDFVRFTDKAYALSCPLFPDAGE